MTSSDSSTSRERIQNQINFQHTIRTYVTDNNYTNADNYDKDDT